MHPKAFEYLVAAYTTEVLHDFRVWIENSSNKNSHKQESLRTELISAYYTIAEENAKLLEENKKLTEKLLNNGISLE